MAYYRDLFYYRPVEKVTRFDILISDPYQGGEHHTIDGTENLSLQEVWEWLCTGGDWSFIVTAHNNPEQVFMRGSTYDDNCFRHAVDGEALMRLCTATKEESEEFRSDVKKRRRAEMKAQDNLQ
jgi:hypothetical protein